MIKHLAVSFLVLQFAFSAIAPPTVDPIVVDPIIVDPIIKPGACYRGGCNGEICAPFAIDYYSVESVDGVMIEDARYSICLNQPWHRCLQVARCERQLNGGCDFTVTVGFMDCMYQLYKPVFPEIFNFRDQAP
jgi:hypothetical protein